MDLNKTKKKSILSYLKFINFILKIFGLSPFEIKETKEGPIPCFSIFGAILTVIYITVYSYCFLNGVKLGNNNEAVNFSPQTQITSFDYIVGLYGATFTVFGLLLNILLTLKDQSKMLSLFWRAEHLCGNFVSKNLYKVIWLCIPYILNFIFVIVTIFILFYFMMQRGTVNGAFSTIVLWILPFAYITFKVLHFIFCVAFVQLGFDHIFVEMNKI